MGIAYILMQSCYRRIGKRKGDPGSFRLCGEKCMAGDLDRPVS